MVYNVIDKMKNNIIVWIKKEKKMCAFLHMAGHFLTEFA